MNKIPQEAEAYTREHRRKKKWLITMACLAAAVALCTVYALSMPAITMENAQQKLACPLSVHQHTDECYDENQALICGKADYAVHTHDSSCSGSDGELVCRLSEIPAHEHTADCYSEPEG